MIDIKISDEIRKHCPEISLGCFRYTAKVESRNNALWERLENMAFPMVQETLERMALNEVPGIRSSRAAYKAFGKDPSRYRVSSEALWRRIGQGKGMYQVNTVVDVNNLISIESGFSVGSYDMRQVGQNLELRLGKAGEAYKGIGKEMLNIENLPVIADETGAFGSSTSDSERAMITEASTDLLTIIYAFSERTALEKIMAAGEDYLIEYAQAQNLASWIID
jgi:DNA/RNA-binding domain of Phe-tRNA-synthetase-like protein